MAKNPQTRLIAGGCRRRDTKKATCCCGFPMTVVSLGRKTQHIWRTAHEATQCLYSPGTHVQHGYVGVDTNRMGSFWFISQTSAEAGHWHQIPWENLKQYSVSKMRVRPNELVCHQSSMGSVFGHVMRMAHDTPAQMAIGEYITPTATAGWQGRPRTTLPTTLDNDLQGVGETAPQQARLATFKNICIRQKTRKCNWWWWYIIIMADDSRGQKTPAVAQ